MQMQMQFNQNMMSQMLGPQWASILGVLDNHHAFQAQVQQISELKVSINFKSRHIF